MSILFMFLILFALLVIGVPVAVSLGVASLILHNDGRHAQYCGIA